MPQWSVLITATAMVDNPFNKYSCGPVSRYEAIPAYNTTYGA